MADEKDPMKDLQVEYNNLSFQLGDLEYRYKISRDELQTKLMDVNKRAAELKSTAAPKSAEAEVVV